MGEREGGKREGGGEECFFTPIWNQRGRGGMRYLKTFKYVKFIQISFVIFQEYIKVGVYILFALYENEKSQILY